MTSFDTEMQVSTSRENHQRINSFIEYTEGYKGLNRNFLENFVLQMGADRLLEVYEEGAVSGINAIFNNKVCILGNKVGFYKRHKNIILGWAQQSFDINQHESVYSMLAFNPYISRLGLTYKQVQSFMNTNLNDSYPQGITDFMNAMVWIISQDLCGQLVKAEKIAMDKKADAFVFDFFMEG